MERLQKYMAACGVASRRKCETLIEDGAVQVNGEIVRELGYKVDLQTDIVKVDGKLIGLPKKVYILMHKPRGYVTTVHDPENRRTVIDLIPDVEERVYPVGRLDYNTSGLLLLTNDGELTNHMTHPSYELDKTYIAKVEGIIKEQELNVLATGVMLEDGITAPAKVALLKVEDGVSILEITIHEGRNRQIRRMLEAVGHPVLALRREKIGFLTLKNLRSGMFRHLELDEVKKLKKIVEVSRE